MHLNTESQFLNVPFSGTRSGIFPLTWGQRWIWSSVTSRAPHYSDLGSSYILAVPDMCDMDGVSRSITALLNRYEAFRSKFSISLDEKPYQLVLDEGYLRAEVRQVATADARAVAETVEAEFNRTPFTLPELSLRATIVASDATPSFVVLCAFHMAMDCHGMLPVLDDFRSFMSAHPAEVGGSVSDDMTHPVDRVRIEEEVDGARRSARGIRFWEQELAKFPKNPLPTGRQPESPRYKAFALHSPAVQAAALGLAAELGVTTASVIHAMAAALVARRAESQACGFVMAASHRYDADAVSYAGTLVQGVPVAVDTADCTPHELIVRTHRAGILAALAGQCDPDNLSKALNNSYGPEETRAKLACVVNLSLPTSAEPTAPLVAETGLTRPQAERLLPESRCEYVEGNPVENERFYLTSEGGPTDFFITLRADTAALASQDIVNFLRDLERSIIDCLPEPVAHPSASGVGNLVSRDSVIVT